MQIIWIQITVSHISYACMHMYNSIYLILFFELACCHSVTATVIQLNYSFRRIDDTSSFFLHWIIIILVLSDIHDISNISIIHLQSTASNRSQVCVCLLLSHLVIYLHVCELSARLSNENAVLLRLRIATCKNRQTTKRLEMIEIVCTRPLERCRCARAIIAILLLLI